jgi:hypothetical protein
MQPQGRDTPISAGAPIHDMSVRLVVDVSLVVKEIVAVADGYPFADCPHAAGSLAQPKGARIAAGWTARVKSFLGKESCTHLVELLIPPGAAACRTLDKSGSSAGIDNRDAHSDARRFVRRWSPAFHVPGWAR